MKILSESPWARTQTVMAGVLGGGQQSNSSRVKDLPSMRSGTTNSGAALSQAGVFLWGWRFGALVYSVALVDPYS